MIVVADTSPVNYLVLIDRIDILWQLYGRVVAPPAVWEELTRPNAPAAVREWVANAPEWFSLTRLASEPDALLAYLGPGEREAIALAEQLRADRLLVDEAAGRQAAVQRQIPVIGTLGVLRGAALRGLIDLRDALARLSRTNFHASAELIEFLLDEDARRRGERQ